MTWREQPQSTRADHDRIRDTYRALIREREAHPPLTGRTS